MQDGFNYFVAILKFFKHILQIEPDWTRMFGGGGGGDVIENSTDMSSRNIQ